MKMMKTTLKWMTKMEMGRKRAKMREKRTIQMKTVKTEMPSVHGTRSRTCRSNKWAEGATQRLSKKQRSKKVAGSQTVTERTKLGS